MGLLGAQVLKGRDQLVMYMGAFVGMSSALRFPTLAPLVAAGLLAGVLFELTDECWVGVGAGWAPLRRQWSWFSPDRRYLMLTMALNMLIALVCGAAGFWLRQNTKLTVTEMSALLALTAGLVLPRIFAEGALFALTCTAVSYAAMCSSERCCSYRQILIISAICSLVIYLGQSVLVGVGGRLGTSARLGTAALWPEICSIWIKPKPAES